MRAVLPDCGVESVAVVLKRGKADSGVAYTRDVVHQSKSALGSVGIAVEVV
jgi:hypothetical protein